MPKNYNDSQEKQNIRDVKLDLSVKYIRSSPTLQGITENQHEVSVISLCGERPIFEANIFAEAIKYGFQPKIKSYERNFESLDNLRRYYNRKHGSVGLFFKEKLIETLGEDYFTNPKVSYSYLKHCSSKEFFFCSLKDKKEESFFVLENKSFPTMDEIEHLWAAAEILDYYTCQFFTKEISDRSVEYLNGATGLVFFTFVASGQCATINENNLPEGFSQKDVSQPKIEKIIKFLEDRSDRKCIYQTTYSNKSVNKKSRNMFFLAFASHSLEDMNKNQTVEPIETQNQQQINMMLEMENELEKVAKNLLKKGHCSKVIANRFGFKPATTRAWLAHQTMAAK